MSDKKDKIFRSGGIIYMKKILLRVKEILYDDFYLSLILLIPTSIVMLLILIKLCNTN